MWIVIMVTMVTPASHAEKGNAGNGSPERSLRLARRTSKQTEAAQTEKFD
jgi:hypothetical protein